MDEISSQLLRQFEAKGLTIKKGIVADALAANFTGRPVSKDKLSY